MTDEMKEEETIISAKKIDPKIKVGEKLFDTKEEMFDYFIKLEKENEELKAEIENLKKTYRKQRNKRIDELQKENKQLKDQITDIKEDVERERNRQRRLEHDFTTDILNNLLSKWS